MIHRALIYHRGKITDLGDNDHSEALGESISHAIRNKSIVRIRVFDRTVSFQGRSKHTVIRAQHAFLEQTTYTWDTMCEEWPGHYQEHSHR